MQNRKTSGRGQKQELEDKLKNVNRVQVKRQSVQNPQGFYFFFLLQIHISDILFRKGYCTSNRKINEALKKNIGLEAAPEILSRICE